MLGCACLTLVAPWAASVDPWFFFAIRVLIGVFEGSVFPSCHSMWKAWAPPLERSILVALAYAGCQFGTAITYPIAGLLCQSLGWQSVFYAIGACGILWTIAWFIFVTDTPATSRWITSKEKEYIRTACHGHTNVAGEKVSGRRRCLSNKQTTARDPLAQDRHIDARVGAGRVPDDGPVRHLSGADHDAHVHEERAAVRHQTERPSVRHPLHRAHRRQPGGVGDGRHLPLAQVDEHDGRAQMGNEH